MIGRTLLVLALALLAAVPAHAVQRARIRSDGTPVHQYPNLTSPQISTLSADTMLPVSTDMVRDVNESFYWYKIRLETGEYGYVQANRIQTEGNLEAAKDQGIDVDAVDAVPREEHPWTFALRAMGIGGYQVSEPQTGLLGAEVELSSCLRLGQRAYARRQFGLGAALQMIRESQIVLGSFIYRIFSDSRTEPEVRLRGGVDTTDSFGVLGLSAGLRHPFSTTYKAHLAGYVEAGFLAPLAKGAAFRVHGSAGLGFHF